jgi:hypothetical protein
VTQPPITFRRQAAGSRPGNPEWLVLDPGYDEGRQRWQSIER